MKAILSFLLLCWLPSCSLAEWRHAFELRADGETVVLDVWMGQRRFGLGGMWSYFGDTLFFPLDAVAGTYWAARAMFDPDLAVAGGPAGWLVPMLPAITTVPPSWDAWITTPLDWTERGGPPLVFPVERVDLNALENAGVGEPLRRAFCDAIASSLARYPGSGSVGAVLYGVWIDYFQDQVLSVARLRR